MNNLKNKNIFDNFQFVKNNTSIKNIISFYGERIIDIFMHLPNSIIDNKLIKELKAYHIDNFVTMDLQVKDYNKNFNYRSPFKVITFNQNNQKVEILFFNMNEYRIKNYLKLDKLYRVTGKVLMSNDKIQIIHPNNILEQENFKDFDELEPEYDLARKKINKKNFRKIIKDNIFFIESYHFPHEWILKEFFDKKWISFKNTLLQLHSPKAKDHSNRLDDNRIRLAFDELLASYLTFFDLKKRFNEKYKSKKILNFDFSTKILKSLPFKLTVDQNNALKEIQKDFSKDQKMYRLIQGDVGSGKTIIALLAVADVIMNGCQSVIMAPTEILAKQHYDYFKNYLSKFDLKVEILTGKTKNKSQIYNKIYNQEIDILIGTHSVYNSSVKFKKLGLIVIDEQHKFGVKQRIKLLEKSMDCHTLIMSATPIPRSLSFAIYGEIEISNIKTKPKGRKEVITSIININQINDLIEGVKRKLANREQVFWILPTIGTLDSEKETLLTRHSYLKKYFQNKVGLLHGKMNKIDIEKTMQEFKEKKIMILVSTTVVEVGINIPNATLMIVEQSERFGLSQLHQLRGRITRASQTSNCVLIHGKELSEISKQRLLILKKSSDGFVIAEKDLFLRGAGDFFGTNQTGLPIWKFFKPHRDKFLIEKVRKNSKDLVNNYNVNKEKINFLKKVFYNNRQFKNFFSV